MNKLYYIVCDDKETNVFEGRYQGRTRGEALKFLKQSLGRKTLNGLVFTTMRKEDIAARGAELGVDYSKTWSCYKGGEVHCGRCGTCVERREAFIIAGVPDPTEYLDTGPLPEKPLSPG